MIDDVLTLLILNVLITFVIRSSTLKTAKQSALTFETVQMSTDPAWISCVNAERCTSVRIRFSYLRIYLKRVSIGVYRDRKNATHAFVFNLQMRLKEPSQVIK